MSNYDYFLHYIKRLQDNNFDSLSLVSGAKGCLDENTIIKTTNGLKKIKDIENKEKVLCFDFKKEKITEEIALKIETGLQDIYEILLDDGSIINATEKHIFFINDDNRIIEKKLKDISIGDTLICCKTEQEKTIG